MFGARNFFLTAARAVIDPLFNYVTLLLTGNGTNGAQNNTFLDSSTNNFTITRNGNTTQGTFTPYGANWSNFFDGTGDSLTVASNSALNGSAFTLEGWFYYTAAGVANTILCSSTGTGGIALGYASGTSWGLASSFVAYRLTTTALPTVNAWNHIVVARSGTGSNQTSIFLNGTRVANGTVTDSFNVTATFIVGWDGNVSNNYFNGYISNLRFVNSDVYGASNTSITVPTAPLTAITGTQLLTCQSNRFIDNSSNNFTITRNGDVSVQRFSPFNPTAPYAAGTIGGSGYFDGAGDYLDTPTTGVFAPTGDFTVSAWFYPISLSANNIIVGNYTGPPTTADWQINITSANNVEFYTNGSTLRISGGPVNIGSWNHFILARSGSTITGYLNGASLGTYTQSGTFGSSSKIIRIGARPQSGSELPVTGYISDVKLIDGSAVATVPTAPQTATSGTRLLLNFTNGGIIDNAMMNDLETVGTAQISTAQSKFGGGSMYFDGSGARAITPSNPNLQIGGGNWTLEGWVKGASQAAKVLFGKRTDASTHEYFVLTNGSGNISFFFNTGANQINSSTPLSNAWQHIAVCSNNGTVTLYINGVASGTPITANLTNGSAVFSIGASGNGSDAFNGYIDDLRVTKGVARYTANFTPPTQAFPLQ